MKQVILGFALFGFAFCGRLEHLYLPPNQAHSHSGGYSSHGAQIARFSSSSNNQAQYSSNTGFYSNAVQSGSINRAANDVPILRLDNNNNGETYSYALETGNGISAQEQGDARGEGTRAQGGFSYTAPDGQVIQLQYTADDNGFQPQGKHLPTPPPVPAEILKALEQNAADEARGIFDDGQYREEARSSEKYYPGYNGQYNAGSSVAAINRQYNSAINNQYIPPAAHQRNYNNGGYNY